MKNDQELREEFKEFWKNRFLAMDSKDDSDRAIDWFISKLHQRDAELKNEIIKMKRKITYTEEFVTYDVHVPGGVHGVHTMEDAKRIVREMEVKFPSFNVSVKKVVLDKEKYQDSIEVEPYNQAVNGVLSLLTSIRDKK